MLKSVHMYDIDVIVPEQPLWQVRVPSPDTRLLFVTVVVSQLPPALEFLRHDMW